MKANIPQPVHGSYLKHRRERTWKVILPVAVSVVLCIAMTVLVNIATFRDHGDVARWAAISTIWIAIPTMLSMLVFLAVLGGMIYLLARLLNILPTYTGKAQDLFYKIEGIARRMADSAARPIIFIDSIGAGINRILGRR